jgi:predicted DNA-binding transcriptional regulator AlpA
MSGLEKVNGDGVSCTVLGRSKNESILGQIEGDHLINIKEVTKVMGVSERTVWRLRANGEIPQGITLGRVVRWSHRSIMDWIADKVAETERSA